MTFITPNQDQTSGGAYAIEQFASACAASMQVHVVVELHDPSPMPGVTMHAGSVIEASALPEADVLVIPADNPRGEVMFNLPEKAGVPVLFFQGYGTPGSAVVTDNLHRCEYVLAVSDWLVDEAKRFGCTAKLVRYGIDRSIFFPGASVGQRRPSVTMMTSPVEWKGTSDGLEAINLACGEVPELEVMLFGHVDPGVPGWSFVPVPERRKIAEMMRGAMILVCPSWEEGLGMPGLEAMACGAAVASTDTKGSRDYAIEGETALVSDPHEPARLADSIVRLVRDSDLRGRCVERGYRKVDALYGDWPHAAERFRAALREFVLTAGRHRR